MSQNTAYLLIEQTTGPTHKFTGRVVAIENSPDGVTIHVKIPNVHLNKQSFTDSEVVHNELPAPRKLIISGSEP